MAMPLTIEQLRQAAAKLPRVALAHLPTPLEDAEFSGFFKGFDSRATAVAGIPS